MSNVVDAILRRVHELCRDDTSGQVADYIPELAAVAPDGFGIALTTTDGYVYEVGDTRLPFTIQSISKPFTYALALADRLDAGVSDTAWSPMSRRMDELIAAVAEQALLAAASHDDTNPIAFLLQRAEDRRTGGARRDAG